MRFILYFRGVKESHLVQKQEACESFLSVDGCHESAVLITCDKNIQKRNCIVLFKFNGKFNIAMAAVQVMQKLICTVSGR